MALTATASYLEQSAGRERDPFEWTPEFSRRARGFAGLGRVALARTPGVAELVDDGCARARRFADALGGLPGVEILNEVVLNQVLVRFGDDDANTCRDRRRVQESGELWLSGTTWQGRAAMRISVTNWTTGPEDIDRSAAAVLKVLSQIPQ